MKIPALLTIAALSCGAAFAQTPPAEPMAPQSATTSDASIARGNRVDGTAARTHSDGRMMGNTAAAAKDSSMAPAATTASTDKTMSKDATVATKEKTGAKKHLSKKSMHKDANKTAAMDDTRSMGASSDMSGSRQARMDAAYANWKSQQK